MSPAELLGAVTRVGLVEQPRVAAPLDEEAWAQLLAATEAEGLLGLLVRGVEDALLPVTDEQWAALATRAEARAVASLLLERALLETTAVLEEKDIPSVVLKGQALSYTAYDDPQDRYAGDVDLLVPRAFAAAADAIAASGATRTVPELRAGFDDRFGKEVTLVRPDGLEVDLHRTFVIGPAGFTAEPEACLQTAERFAVGGRSLLALAPEEALLHASLVAAFADDPPRLVTLRDIAQLAIVRGVDTERVIVLASRWRARSALASALLMTWARLGLRMAHPLIEFARSYRSTPLERLIDRSYHGAGRSYTSQAAAVLVLPDLRQRLAYLAALAVPSKAYRQARGWRAGEHWLIARRSLQRQASR